MKDQPNDGKQTEKLASEAFKIILSNKEGVFTRLYDTKSSGRFLPPSPGDFMGGCLGKAVLFECKSSDVKKSFSDCDVKSYVEPTQFGYHKLWLIAGNVGLFLFESIPYKSAELWSSTSVMSMYRGEKAGGPIAEIKADKYEVATAIVNYMRGIQ